MSLTRKQLVEISEEAMKVAQEAANNLGTARVIANHVAEALVTAALKNYGSGEIVAALLEK